MAEPETKPTVKQLKQMLVDSSQAKIKRNESMDEAKQMPDTVSKKVRARVAKLEAKSEANVPLPTNQNNETVFETPKPTIQATESKKSTRRAKSTPRERQHKCEDDSLKRAKSTLKAKPVKSNQERVDESLQSIHVTRGSNSPKPRSKNSHKQNKVNDSTMDHILALTLKIRGFRKNNKTLFNRKHYNVLNSIVHFYDNLSNSNEDIPPKWVFIVEDAEKIMLTHRAKA